jgi:hypothetical protein
MSPALGFLIFEMLLVCKYIDYTGNPGNTKYNKQYTQRCHDLISFPSKRYAKEKKITIAATPLAKIQTLNSSGLTIWAATMTPKIIFAMS